jgi:NAD-dependent deacetylase
MNIVILTGAGVSVASGIAPFHSETGLWQQSRVEDICTADALARNPYLVCSFYDDRKKEVAVAEPNLAHIALAELERFWRDGGKGNFLLVTQNIDDLHERAGSLNTIHMHGNLNSAQCMECGWQGAKYGLLEDHRECPTCEQETLRPDIVLFGEAPRQMARIEDALKLADLFVSIGTSGLVYPAAGYVHMAKSHGAKTYYFNIVEPSINSGFDHCRVGKAESTVPEWVSEFIG